MEFLSYEDALKTIEDIPSRFMELLEEQFEYNSDCQLVRRVENHYTFYFIDSYSVKILYLDMHNKEFGEKWVNDYEFFDRYGDPLPSENEFLEQLKTRREAEQYVKLSSVAFQHHLREGNIKPCKESGQGKGKVQLFWKKDLEKLKKILK